MVSILEVYQLKCTACGKPQRVRRLHVYGNLQEIERTYVCAACEQHPPAASEDRSAPSSGDGDEAAAS